ncbi:hypothetical protein ABES25_07535 [Bacillus gobiensis]|uniref:hypothetical protein n=1 Tax=Bacillus gobiensis TaxID=1441095 RepID=UPI003D1EAB6E
MKALECSYDNPINGDIPRMDTFIELADCYLQKNRTLDEKAKKFNTMAKYKSATSGLLTSFSGLITLPVAVPQVLHSLMNIVVCSIDGNLRIHYNFVNFFV